MAVGMGVYVSGGVSGKSRCSLWDTGMRETQVLFLIGGHINPAVTTAMVLLGRVPAIKMPFYWIGQYLGCFFGAFGVWVVYYGKH